MTGTLILAPERTGEDVAALAERKAALLAGAVDVLEVTAGLEAEGIGDRNARAYGYDDVFALAEALYRGTVRRPPLPEPPPDPWRAEATSWKAAGRFALRGVLFGLPGVGYVAAAPLLKGTGAGLVPTLSLLLCWPLGQGVAALAYSRPNLGATRRVLRLGVVLGFPAMAAVAAALGVLLGVPGTVVAVACAQSLYLLGATAALVTGGELWLLLVLLPGAAVTLAAPAGVFVLAGWAVTGMGVVAVAYERTRGGDTTGVSWIAARAAAPHALFGLLAAGLLTFTILAAYGGFEPPTFAAGAAMVALSVSMGPAEWVLFAFRARGRRLLHASHTLQAFAWQARMALVDVLGRYLAVLTVLLAAAFALAGPDDHLARTYACFLLLGGALVVALLLQSCGHGTAALVACSCTLAAETTAMVAVGPDPAGVQLGGAVALFTALLVHAATVLGRATAHR